MIELLTLISLWCGDTTIYQANTKPEINKCRKELITCIGQDNIIKAQTKMLQEQITNCFAKQELK